MKNFLQHHLGYFLWILGIIILSFASFWRLLGFGLWKDDLSLIWSSLYNTHFYHGYFNHPGTPLEFFLLSPIFGTNAFLWQALGLSLHVIISILVGLFLKELTQSKKIGIIAGLFFAASYLGLETIYFPSVQVTQIATIPLLASLIYFIKSLKNSTKYLLFSIIYFLLSIFLDPPRVIPIVVLLPLLLFLFPKNKTIVLFRKITLITYPIFFIVLSTAFVWWFAHYSLDTLLGKAIHEGLIKPAFILSKIHVLGHFFATIANMFTGLVWDAGQDEQNTGIYHSIFGYLGLGIFFATVAAIFAWFKLKKKFFGLISFLILWIFLFYFPNWVSEPRAPMAGAHRYVFLSSIGFIGLITYFLSFIPNKKVFYCLAILFLGLNIFKANVLLTWQNTYRANNVITGIWNTINVDVPKGETNSIFMFYGQQPWLSEDIGLSGAAPFALLRNPIQKQFTDPIQMPIFTTDTNAINNYLCFSHQKIINLYFVEYKKDRIPLSHIHGWEVLPGGKLVDISEKERTILRALSIKNGCNPLP